MEITREKSGELTEIITLKVSKEDYSEPVEKRMKSLRNRVSIPGFRPGKVPASMVQRLYGTQVLAEEIQNLTIEKLFSYLKEENVDYLAEPLPSAKQEPIDWQHQADFSFAYEVALMPDMEIKLPKADGLEEFNATIDDAMVEEEIKKIQRDFGTFEDKDTLEDEDFGFGKLDLGERTNDEGETEPWIIDNVYLAMDRLEEEAKSILAGKKTGDTIEVNPSSLSTDRRSLAIYLGLKDESELEGIPAKGMLTLTRVTGRKNAEVNQELYDKVFGEGVVADDDAFRNAIRNYLAYPANSQSAYFLMREIKQRLENENPFDIPEEFLKRWLLVSNQENKDFDAGKIESEWPEYIKAFRWEIISTRLAQKYEIKLSAEEVKEEARRQVQRRLRDIGYANIPEDRENEIVQNFMKNKSEMDRLQRNMLDGRVLDSIRIQLALTVTEKPFSELMEWVREQEAKEKQLEEA
jgi:trigger factor